MSYFNTVLRPDGQQAYPPHVADASQLRPVDNGASSGPFDMLGFMSEITSELERKHLDLTNGLSEFTDATSSKVSEDTADASNTIRSMSWDSSVYSKGTQSQSPAPDGMWPETGAAYEEHLLAYFLNSEPPPTIFGPVNLEWKYVREVIVAQSRDFRPLRNSIYCFAEVHKAIKEGNQPHSASTYHQQASLEGQSYIFGQVDEPTLGKVFTTVFLLMLSEVCKARPMLRSKKLTKRSTVAIISGPGPPWYFFSPLSVPIAAALSRADPVMDWLWPPGGLVGLSLGREIPDCRPRWRSSDRTWEPGRALDRAKRIERRR